MSNDYAAPLSTLDVHLDAVARNWLYLRKMLAAGADCAGVVKADAYGLGAVQVSRALFDQGCRHFFVAHYGEALAVAAALEGRSTTATADLPSVYVLNGPRGAPARDFLQQRFIPVLNSMDDIDYWAQHAPGQPAVVHIDTGMNRFGLDPAQAGEALAQKLKAIDVRYVMSHLACADESNNEMNARQLADFRCALQALGRTYRLSFANSGGIFLGPDYHFDLVRPGCALYGINPTDRPNPMRGVVTLRARITQLRDVPAGATLGYGAACRAVNALKCATVSVGYADGYLRSLTGGGHVFVHGVKCPVLGRVSMDSIIVDVTAVPQVSAGDMAEIIGENQTVDDVAAQAGTIGYEILTSLGPRYKRTYIGT